MNRPLLLLTVSALGNSLVSLVTDARPDPGSGSSMFGSVFLAYGEPSFRFSASEGAESPISLIGVAESKGVHAHNLNERMLIALIVACTLLGGMMLYLLCFLIYRRKKTNNSAGRSRKILEVKTGSSLSQIMARFNSSRSTSTKDSVAAIDYNSLVAATNNFRESNLIGEDCSKSVHKACFDDKMVATVKRIDISSGEDGEREFENEINWLSKIQHRNIIKLFGYCIKDDTRFLVCEMMQNGSLEAQLHGPARGSSLTWHLRMMIAVDVARGLKYLHEHCNPPVVHRDLRSSNILLDANFNAKLSDFGLARALGDQNDNIKLSGTSGYVAPEYLADGKLTDKSDVYAFGVVLLQLLTGKWPVEKTETSQSQSIVAWAIPQLTDRSKLPTIVDPAMKNTMDLKHLYQVAAVAVLCVQAEPSYRPLITDVLHSLIPLVPLELGGSLRLTGPVLPVEIEPSQLV